MIYVSAHNTLMINYQNKQTNLFQNMLILLRYLLLQDKERTEIERVLIISYYQS